MRIMKLSQIKGNELLAKSIFDEAGRVLLAKGTLLNREYIKLLARHDVETLYIEDEDSKGIELEEAIHEQTRQNCKKTIKNTFEKYVKNEKANVDAIYKSANQVIDEILSNKEVMINATEMRTKSDDIFGHCVNVCALSVITGLHIGYNMLKLKDLASGALLHDIGKADLFHENKVETNEHKQLIKQHPKRGYDILKDDMSISSYTKAIVVLHHERYDGSGYPFGMKKEEVHELARLTAVCDTFDLMVSGKSEYGNMHVYEVVEYLTATSGILFDANFVNKFLNNVAIYPTGTGVVLNTGEKALVRAQNKSIPLRPIVRLIYDKNGKKYEKTIDVDLIKEKTLFITGCCEI